MTPKSTTGKTNKYSNLAQGVKKTQEPEEPKLTENEVREIFSSFNFPINERGHNDILYWTNRGVSEKPKLIEELHKKRMDIIKAEDDDIKNENDRQKASQKDEDDRQRTQQKAENDKKTAHETLSNKQFIEKATMPRLSDEDLAALFDEYGLPAPDPEWARTHLPNDPKKIRSILEMQRKTADDMLKKHSKNAVNSVPEVPKPGSMPAPTPMGGMGGPMSPMSMQGGMTGMDEEVTPFFVGDHALVRIVNPNNPQSGTLWLVDKKRKVLRPIGSEKALENAFEDPEEALRSIVTLSSKALAKGGPLAGFTPLDGKKGLQNDGSMEDIEFSPAQLQNRYNKPQDIAGENKSLSVLDGLMGQLQTQQQ